jgi:hypothetical protein
MGSFDRLQSGCIRLIPAAALLAAVFVPFVAASADDDCPPDGCPLPPPQSREVNPAPAGADGSTVEVANAAELTPVEITVHVLAPPFFDPAPVVASFESIDVQVRYQNPGDLSCGVQALGMALDALPGAAPTSASLLGLLQEDGMMYDFGTGVEELAYAAQSFGYTGSFAFHGASFEQLRAQVASGSPVVVSLGANGEGNPGHFVTVTGISSDGEWVGYNDPTLGRQVISASEFERLWGLQGDSGVAVATEPPAAAGADPGVLSLWVAFAAGLMALVSTTPLARFRQGIGGMLDAYGGRGVSYAPIRTAQKSSPSVKEKEKEKEKEPKASKPRFDDEIVLPPTPPKAVTARFDDELSLPSPPPVTEARFDDEIAGVTTPLIPASTVAAEPRDDRDDPDPTPEPVRTPGAAGESGTPQPDNRGGPEGTVVSTTTAITHGTPSASGTASRESSGQSGERDGLPALPDKYLKYLTSLTLLEHDTQASSVPLGVLTIGTRDAFHADIQANPDLRLTPTKLITSIAGTTVKVGWGGATIEIAILTPEEEFYIEGLGTSAKVRQSGSLSLTWDGWNTISRAEYDPFDFTLSGSDDEVTPSGSGVNGVYVEQKPMQEYAFTAVEAAALGVALLGHFTLAGNPMPLPRPIPSPLDL